MHRETTEEYFSSIITFLDIKCYEIIAVIHVSVEPFTHDQLICGHEQKSKFEIAIQTSG